MKGKFRAYARILETAASLDVGRLAWIQRFNDVKTRAGDEGTARDFFVARFQEKFHLLNRRRRRAARRNAVGKFGTELYSLSLSRREREFIGVIPGPGCSVSRQLLINQTGITRYRAG